MPLIDEPKTSLDNTVRLFDQFYTNTLVVNATEYDIVFSYFLSVCATRNIARNFATFLFKISNIIDEPVMTLLDYIRGKSGLEVNTIMAYYLNSVRSKTALYGVSSIPTPNQSVQRNIVI